MPENNSPSTGSQCPSCGITVAAGYPKCPKCHASMPNIPNMPSAAAKVPASARGPQGAGGTAIEPSSVTAWVAGVVALLLIGGGTIYFLARGDGGTKQQRVGTAAAPAPGRGAVVVVQPNVRAFRAADPDASVAAPDVAEPLSVRRNAAASVLRDRLGAERLWADVEMPAIESDSPATDGAALVLKTAYCADPKLRAVVDKLAGTMRAARFTKLRCEARHGALVFELTL